VHVVANDLTPRPAPRAPSRQVDFPVEALRLGDVPFVLPALQKQQGRLAFISDALDFPLAHPLAPALTSFMAAVGVLKARAARAARADEEARVSGVVPTLRGFINVTAAPGAADVTVPCGMRATLCTPRSSSDTVRLTAAAFALTLDGAEVAAVESAGHLCTAAPVGCGAGGAPRVLRTRARK
jgi:hypothetical protein